MQDGLGHPGELVVDLEVLALGMLENEVFQIPHFFSETVQLCQEDVFLFGFVGETTFNLLVFSLLSFTAFVGGDAVSFEVLCPPGADGLGG